MHFRNGDYSVAASAHKICYIISMSYDRDQNTRDARAWRHRASDALMVAFGGKCVCCGYSRCRAALDFHHANGKNKKDLISVLLATRSWKRIVREVVKCVLVCCRCHREIHAGLKVSPKPIKYKFPKKLVTVGGKGGNRGSFQKKLCPVPTQELRSLRAENSFDALSVILKANKRTVMRWCKELGN